MLSTLLKLSLLVASWNVVLSINACHTYTNQLYRVLRPDENCNTGLWAKDRTAHKSLEDHVGNGSTPGFKSQFISTTTEYGIARKWQSKNRNLRIVSVSRNSINNAGCKVYDLNVKAVTDRYLKSWKAKNYARASCEVVLQCSRALHCNYV